MRYWIKYDGTDYSPSTDDMSRFGYAEVSQRPELYTDVWVWDFDAQSWVIDKVRYLDQLAINRHKNEIKGVTYQGKQYDTDDRARMAMIAIITYAPATAEFKLADGSYQTMTLAELKALFSKVMEYTMACYAHEKDVKEFVDEGAHDITMLDNSWPNNDLDASSAPSQDGSADEPAPTGDDSDDTVVESDPAASA